MLLGAGGAEDNAKRSARAAFMLELLGNAAQEGLFVLADWYVLDAIPTPTAGYPNGGGLRNEQPQTFVVYDTVPPTFTTTLPSTAVEATRSVANTCATISAPCAMRSPCTTPATGR